MTFIPATVNNVSTLNSTSSTLTASSVFLGTSEDVSRYSSLSITITSDVDSAPVGVELEFSTDDTNWDIVDAFTYSARTSYEVYDVKIVAQYFRLRYTNGTTNQTQFRLQTKFEIGATKKSGDSPMSIDAFARLRVSKPFTLISQNHVKGKNESKVYEDVVSSATSVYNSDASHILMSTTGSGSVIRRHRTRAVYQPGKSLLVFMTGVLDNGTNASTVTTKIGYYDDDNGFYFQHVNGVVSVVKRTSVTGSLVETTVDQEDWNINTVDGTTNGNFDLDVSKTIIYWFNMEWLGVGFADAGVVINGEFIKVHRFQHSNLLTTPYITTASLNPTYEIISTGGAGSMTAICYTVISEGGYSPIGDSYSGNMGTTTQTVNAREPLIVMRLKSGTKSNAVLDLVSVMSTSGANARIEVYRFYDTTAGSILNNTTFVSAGTDSDVEYNVLATTIAVTNGLLISSVYIANNNDSVNLTNGGENAVMSISGGISDLIAVCVTTVGANENFVASLNWREYI